LANYGREWVRGMAVTADEMKRDLHALVDRLPADAWDVARRVLAALVAQAGQDAEPLTPEEEASSEEGWQAYLRGEGKPLEQVWRDLAKK